MSPGGIQGLRFRYTPRIAQVGKPPITITCDCGASSSVPYGERWHCDSCGRTWDTTQIPADEYATLLRSVRSFKLLIVVPPLLAAAGQGYGEGFAANHHKFAPGGMLAAVRYLVEELHADVNAREHEGNTAIHNAAARGDNEMILYLVSKGADPDRKSVV